MLKVQIPKNQSFTPWAAKLVTESCWDLDQVVENFEIL